MITDSHAKVHSIWICVDHYGLGVSLAGAKRTSEAVYHFLEALRLNPNFAEARRNLALTPCIDGEITAAIAGFHQALELSTAGPILGGI
jgi:Flp pilus assembly protein TadD